MFSYTRTIGGVFDCVGVIVRIVWGRKTFYFRFSCCNGMLLNLCLFSANFVRTSVKYNSLKRAFQDQKSNHERCGFIFNEM